MSAVAWSEHCGHQQLDRDKREEVQQRPVLKCHHGEAAIIGLKGPTRVAGIFMRERLKCGTAGLRRPERSELATLSAVATTDLFAC